jgi:hypothetical protein
LCGKLARDFAGGERLQCNGYEPRNEFFFASRSDLRDVLMKMVGDLHKLTETADAMEYRQSLE